MTRRDRWTLVLVLVTSILMTAFMPRSTTPMPMCSGAVETLFGIYCHPAQVDPFGDRH